VVVTLSVARGVGRYGQNLSQLSLVHIIRLSAWFCVAETIVIFWVFIPGDVRFCQRKSRQLRYDLCVHATRFLHRPSPTEPQITRWHHQTTFFNLETTHGKGMDILLSVESDLPPGPGSKHNTLPVILWTPPLVLLLAGLSVLPDLERETSNQGYGNKPKRSDGYIYRERWHLKKTQPTTTNICKWLYKTTSPKSRLISGPGNPAACPPHISSVLLRADVGRIPPLIGWCSLSVVWDFSSFLACQISSPSHRRGGDLLVGLFTHEDSSWQTICRLSSDPRLFSSIHTRE